MTSETKATHPFSTVDEALIKSRDYFIEYGGFLSNHMSHAAVALKHLPGRDDAAAVRFLNEYTNKLEDPSSAPFDKSKVIDIHSFKQWEAIPKGTRSYDDYQSFLAYFDRLLSMPALIDDVVNQHLKHIVFGLSGALLHPIIHLGFGVREGDRKMVAEGLAYLSAFHLTFEHDPHSDALWKADSVSQTFKDLPAEDNGAKLIHAFIDAVKQASHNETFTKINKVGQQDRFSSLDNGGIQRKITTAVLAPKETALPIIPPFVSSHTDLSVEAWQHALSKLITYLYIHSDDDFVVLHGVTSLYAVSQLLPMLPDDATRRRVLDHWLQVAFVASLSMEVPGVRSVLTDISAGLPVLHSDNTFTEQEWVTASVEASRGHDEHLFKLVFVMREFWEKFKHNALYCEAVRVANRHKGVYHIAVKKNLSDPLQPAQSLL